MTRRARGVCTVSVVFLCAALTLTACTPISGKPIPSATERSDDSAIPDYDPDEIVWFAEPYDTEGLSTASSGDQTIDEGAPITPDQLKGEPDTTALPSGESSADPNAAPSVAEEPTPADSVDPCVLLPLSEWIPFAGTSGQSGLVLDAYESCVFLTTEDLVRAVVEVTYPEDVQGELATLDADGITFDLATGVALAEKYPTPFADTAIAKGVGGALFSVTIYNRDPQRADTADVAEQWAIQARGDR